MKKSTVSHKTIAQKRLARSKLMKIKTSELNVTCKENAEPPTPFVSKFNLKTHEIETENFGRANPFDLPNRHRLYSKSMGLRKEKPVPFIMSEPFTICDIDSTFYKCIEGRPLRQSDDIKVYIRTIRDITLLKANTAYLKDQIIQVDQSFADEKKYIEKIEGLANSCRANFAHFITENYNEALAIQEAAKEKEKELCKISDELDGLYFNYVALRNKLEGVMVNLDTLLRYRQFLISLSPEAWRNENNQNQVGFKFNETVMSDDPICEYKLKLDTLKEISLKLYFRRPKTLVSIFNHICHLCLTYMGINGFMSNIITSVVKQRNLWRAQVTAEVNEMQELVELFKNKITFEEETEQATKAKFEKILINDFQISYASYDGSKLFTCLQFTNTQIFHGPEDPKDSIVALMLNLELNYIELTSALDNLNQDVVKEATKDFFSKDIKIMRNAHKAQRSLKECDILSKSLYTSFEPSRKKRQWI